MVKEENRRSNRRDIEKDFSLDRDDLFLLLESYRNTIELNTTLLERQEVLNTGLEKVLGEMIKICSNQVAIVESIGKLPNDIRELIDALCAGTSTKCEELHRTIDNHRKAEIKEHGAHQMRIYAAFSVLGALTIALVGLLVKIWPTMPGVLTMFPGP